MGTQSAIADHGLIGDLQTAALVATDGAIDWFCAPRFDSPSSLAGLLDDQKGGHFRIAPDGVDYVTKQPFEKILTYSDHLGLYSEEIAPTGEQIGNFLQAFSHLALISAAINLDYQLDHGAGSVEPLLAHSATSHRG
jgi:GH15 family glucan-1,4-alpha-glucosidase